MAGFETILAVLFIAVLMIIAGVYYARRNSGSGQIASKQLTDDDSDVTESEPELEIHDKKVDKMKIIPEEQQQQNDNKNKKKTKNNLNDRDMDNKSSDANTNNNNNNNAADDDDDYSDSEEFSMKRMVEEYHKSRTLAKKFAEIIEDISDTFKRKSIEIKNKFAKEHIPVVIPMSFEEKLKKLNKNKNIYKKKDKFKSKKKQKNKDKNDKNVFKQIDNDFQVKFVINDDGGGDGGDKDVVDGVDVVDSQDEFGDFNSNNFDDFDDDKDVDKDDGKDDGDGKDVGVDVDDNVNDNNDALSIDCSVKLNVEKDKLENEQLDINNDISVVVVNNVNDNDNSISNNVAVQISIEEEKVVEPKKIQNGTE